MALDERRHIEARNISFRLGRKSPRRNRLWKYATSGPSAPLWEKVGWKDGSRYEIQVQSTLFFFLCRDTSPAFSFPFSPFIAQGNFVSTIGFMNCYRSRSYRNKANFWDRREVESLQPLSLHLHGQTKLKDSASCREGKIDRHLWQWNVKRKVQFMKGRPTYLIKFADWATTIHPQPRVANQYTRVYLRWVPVRFM